MIDYVYSVATKKIYIYCEIEEYCYQIEKWLTSYTVISTKQYDLYIKIYKNKTLWNIDGNQKFINKKLKKTDLYPLFYNLIANAVLDDANILLHSAVLRYNNLGVLVVGDFNSGKTTLCLEAKKNFSIASADQTQLFYKNGKLLLSHGSLYMKINKSYDVFLEPTESDIEIKLILNLSGLCNNGILLLELLNNKEYIIKKMFKFATWHSDIPLFTEEIILTIDRIKIYNWLSKLNIPFYNVRGDSKDVVNKIKEILE